MNYEKLLSILETTHIGNSFIAILINARSTQIINVQNIYSNKQTVECGVVPQDTVLGPILPILYRRYTHSLQRSNTVKNQTEKDVLALENIV